MKPTVLILSCQHAANDVPEAYTALFKGHKGILETHEAVDVHAREITLHLHEVLGVKYTLTSITRLLIDCNRSLIHQRCFSKITKTLSPSEKQALIDQYYRPFQQQTHDLIQANIAQDNQVLHLSINTFPPTKEGITHNAGIGILYDFRRHAEKEVARLWHGLLSQQTPRYRVRMNYPYPGHHHDNFLNSLRHEYPERDYLGLEIECNQALLETQTSKLELLNVLSNSLKELMQLL